MVGVAAAAAHCLVGSFLGGWKLERRNESRGSAEETLGGDEQSFSIHWTVYSARCLLFFTMGYGIVALTVASSQKNRRRGEEHGSAQWGDVFQIAKRYRDKKHPKENLILTQHFQMGLDGHKHKRNTNVLVIGG